MKNKVRFISNLPLHNFSRHFKMGWMNSSGVPYHYCLLWPFHLLETLLKMVK